MNDGLNRDKRGDANEHEYFGIETRWFRQVHGHVCEQVEGLRQSIQPWRSFSFDMPLSGRSSNIQSKQESRRINQQWANRENFLTVGHRLGALASRPGFVVERPNVESFKLRL
jgi:hypothetical protein